jgi:hypothetical protein
MVKQVMNSDTLSILGPLLAGILTLFTLSYVFADNQLFRSSIYLFIGVAAGYAGAIAIDEIIWPQLFLPIQAWWFGAPQVDFVEIFIRLLLSLLLLSKLFPRISSLGNPVMAMLVGVGASLAIAGAVRGTILPQLGASSSIFDINSLLLALQGGYLVEGGGILLKGFITLLAMISTLAYFHFGARSRGHLSPERSIFVDSLAWLGNIFIPVTLATIFSGVLLTALSALIERLDFLLSLISKFSGAN